MDPFFRSFLVHWSTFMFSHSGFDFVSFSKHCRLCRWHSSFRYPVCDVIFRLNNAAFDNRTKSAREIWRQMQATRYHKANPKLKINTEVLGTAAAPEVVFKFIDETEVSSDAHCVSVVDIVDGVLCPCNTFVCVSLTEFWMGISSASFYINRRNDTRVNIIQLTRYSLTSTCLSTTSTTNLKWVESRSTINSICY